VIGPKPGPFDEPPAEPIELDPETLPWELREAEESREAATSTD
jgi:hypothetical protein